MWLESECNNDGVVVAINVGIDSVKAFEYLADLGRKILWKRCI